MAIWRARVSSCCACSGISSQRGLRPASAPARRECAWAPSAARSARTAPRGWRSPARPIARCETPSPRRSHRTPPAPASGCTNWSAESVASTTACPPKSRCTAAAPSSQTWELSSAAERSRVSSNSDCDRRSRLAEMRAWKRRPAVSWPVSKPTTSMTAKVTTYCASDDRKREPRRHEEEIEGGDAHHRREGRRSAAGGPRHQHHAQQEDHDDVGQVQVASAAACASSVIATQVASAPA